jgi:putative iron-dependent peroxidase
MRQPQPGILDSLPAHGRYLFFDLFAGADPRPSLQALRDVADGRQAVIGMGHSLTLALGAEIDGLRVHPALVGKGIELPSTPSALWCWLRGDDRGDLFLRARAVEQTVSEAFGPVHAVDGFRHGSGLDLTGYEDGTENPQGDDAAVAAFVKGTGAGLDGGSFVAVQQWQHDFDSFESMSPKDRDNAIGRRKSDNEELIDAPISAHVKRTAQESFEPEAFILRRSMPWSDEQGDGGLLFVAFGKSFDAFEAQIQRMIGAEDGTQDALFQFTRPISGCYFWCPPVRGGRLDLSALGM